jgi:hypothetical protein
VSRNPSSLPTDDRGASNCASRVLSREIAFQKFGQKCGGGFAVLLLAGCLGSVCVRSRYG